MIRMVEDSDAKTLCAWYDHYIENTTITFETNPVTNEEFLERIHRIRKEYPWIVLEEDGVLKGYAYLDHFNARAAYDTTADVTIYLDPNERGKAYGSKLMEALIRMAKADGYCKLVSLITSENERSCAFHERFGFTCVGHLKQCGYKMNRWLGMKTYEKDLNLSLDEPPVRRNLSVEEVLKENSK